MPLAGSRALLPASHQHCWEKVGSVPASISVYLVLVNSPLSLLPSLISLAHHQPFLLLLAFLLEFYCQVHSFIQKIFFEILLRAKHCSKLLGVYTSKQNKYPCSLGAYLRERGVNNR